MLCNPMANVREAMMSNAHGRLSLPESILMAFPALLKLSEAPFHVAQTIPQAPTTVEILTLHRATRVREQVD